MTLQREFSSEAWLENLPVFQKSEIGKKSYFRVLGLLKSKSALFKTIQKHVLFPTKLPKIHIFRNLEVKMQK